ncbi:hypothetical protein [Cupriavidus oxalaticus]|nr:hypothetical protein [Cupriavidus oxalaticus]QRQ86253.1 hypothetical protein JTE91_23890 [Cupriavidus oxalaticus]QRQ95420.1 hypothetical protein JTE92_18370 [Cupriavidus oxalaticus]WQD84077.1 hypothetical protein U0036_06080 [Cupriavidus oxalaticus]
MTGRILARLGEDAVLRGSTPCRVNIERNVEVSGADGLVYSRTVATLQKSFVARKGDTLALVDADGQPLPDHSFVVDGPAFEDNGYTARYVLRSA